MANIITAKIVYAGCENKIWRKIQISDNTMLCRLGYTILATFDTMGYHMFYIEHNGVKYRFPVKGEKIKYEECLLLVKILALKLKVGDHLEMVYDFELKQTFEIEITDIFPISKSKEKNYPRIIAGEGAGIIDNMPSSQLLDLIHEIDKTGKSTYYYDFDESDEPWNYRNYNLRYDNFILESVTEIIDEGYLPYCNYIDFDY